MFTKILDIYARVILFVIIVLMFALIFSVGLQILGRYVPFIPRFLWAEEVARFSLIWTILLGSMIGVREEKHFYVDFLPRNMPKWAEIAIRVIYYVFMLLVAGIFITSGYRYYMMGYIQSSELTGLNLAWLYVSVPIAGVTWLLFLIERAWLEITRGRQSRPDMGKEIAE